MPLRRVLLNQQIKGDAAVSLHAKEEHVLIEVELGVVKGRATGASDAKEKETAFCLLEIVGHVFTSHGGFRFEDFVRSHNVFGASPDQVGHEGIIDGGRIPELEI